MYWLGRLRAGEQECSPYTGVNELCFSGSQAGATMTAKEEVEQLLHKLPENCSSEDIRYHLYVLDKVRRGLEDAREHGTLSQQEAEARLKPWLTE